MSNVLNNDWDTEQVLAFVHDVRPWRAMDDAEKAEWVRRVKHIRENVTTGGEPWTNARLAVLFGLRITGLEDRFRRSGAKSDPGAQQNSWADRRTRIEEQAKAEAEAAGQKALADAIAKADREKREVALAAKQEQEKALKAQQDKIRKEEQAKAKAAADKEIAELKAKMAEAAKAAKFDISTLTAADKAKVMTMLANDPESASEFFEAQTKERARKAAITDKQRKEREAKRAQDKINKEKQAALERARKDYESGSLNFFFNTVLPIVEQYNVLLDQKPPNLDHLIISKMGAQDVVNQTESVDDVMDKTREYIFAINAELAMQDIVED